MLEEAGLLPTPHAQIPIFTSYRPYTAPKPDSINIFVIFVRTRKVVLHFISTKQKETLANYENNVRA